jgi:hypothetical protein
VLSAILAPLTAAWLVAVMLLGCVSVGFVLARTDHAVVQHSHVVFGPLFSTGRALSSAYVTTTSNPLEINTTIHVSLQLYRKHTLASNSSYAGRSVWISAASVDFCSCSAFNLLRSSINVRTAERSKSALIYLRLE